MRGQVRTVIWENGHAFIGKRMQEVQYADEKKGNAQEEQIAVAQKPFRIPGRHKDSTGYDYREYLRQTVEKEVIVPAGEIEEDQNASHRKYGKMLIHLS